MSEICLYYLPESGPCRTVLLTAEILGLNLNLKYLDLFKGEHFSAEYLKLNPQHAIPTLTDGDFVLSESRAIITYLCDQYGTNDKLYPKDLQKRAIINQRLYFDISRLYGPIFNCYGPVYYGKNFNESERRNIEAGFEIFEKFLTGAKYAAGNEFTVADIALVSTVDTAVAVLDFDLKPYPNVNKWFENLKHSLPKFDEIITKNSQKLKALVNDFKSGKRTTNPV